MSFPDDLVPLPTMPYEERPLSLPLDIEECRTALWRCNGNVSDAALLLKVRSDRLRKFVKNSPYLSAQLQEAQETLKDIAESNVRDALMDQDDPGRRDAMTRFVLTNLGADRGYGQKGNNKGSIQIGDMKISWGDGSDIAAPLEEDNDVSGPVLDGVEYKAAAE